MKFRRISMVLAASALVIAACGGDDDDDDAGAATAEDTGGGDTAETGGEATGGEATGGEATGGEATGGEATGGEATGGDCVVGVSWNNYQEPRWAGFDEPAIKAAVEAGGGTYVSNDADSSAEVQATNIENLISQGANVLIILAQDGVAVMPSVAAAIDAGVPVIAYDRLIEDPNALYISFDNVKVGELEASAILDVVSEGNFVIIKGNSADANSDFLREGYVNAGIPPVGENSDTITIVGESYTDNWDPTIAQTTMEQYLTANNNEVDAVLSENDGMAGGVIAALEAQGLAGVVPVSGQDGDHDALNRVALGTQTVDVWKDGRDLGKVAGEAALTLCDTPDISAVEGTAPFTTGNDVEMTSILLDPVAITQDNLDLVVDSGWIDQETLCNGVEPGSVDACG